MGNAPSLNITLPNLTVRRRSNSMPNNSSVSDSRNSSTKMRRSRSRPHKLVLRRRSGGDDDDNDDNDDNDDDDDDDMICSSYDERNPLYSQKREYLKQQMEKDVVIQQGYMYKYRKNALKKKWKKYWFVIRSGNLFIYKNEQEYVVKSIIPLENTKAIC